MVFEVPSKSDFPKLCDNFDQLNKCTFRNVKPKDHFFILRFSLAGKNKNNYAQTVHGLAEARSQSEFQTAGFD